MDEFALWGTVRKMREVYGLFAAMTAAQRAKKAYEKGELDRYDRWTRIEELLSAPAAQRQVADRRASA